MNELAAATRDTIEEVELGRTLLLQGHLDTAQKVLVRLCQQQPECSEAFRILAMVLFKRGDDRRGQPLLDYADELDVQQIFKPTQPGEDSFSDAKTLQTRRPASAELRRPDSLQSSSSAGSSTTLTPTAPAPSKPPILPNPMPGPPMVLRPKRGGATIFFLLLGAGAAAWAAYKYRDRLTLKSPSPVASSQADLNRALASGALDVLSRMRDIAIQELAEREPTPDSLVRLALVEALLADDYGIGAKQDAEALLKRAARAPTPNRELDGLAASARALFALSAHDRVSAKSHADAALATATPSAWALLASARVRGLAGDAAGALRGLDRAFGVGASLGPVVVDWAMARLDGGDPAAAKRVLAELVSRELGNSRARIALAKAERALGEAGFAKNLELACGADGKRSRVIRAECEVQEAFRARLAGDRPLALTKARAVAEIAGEPDLLAESALALASLGEIDAADQVLGRARKLAEPTAVSLAWADLSIRLGRGMAVGPSGLLERPAGSERVMLAMRATYASKGAAGLAFLVKSIPSSVQDFDEDIRLYAALSRSGRLAEAESANLTRRAEKGSPVAAYVLGVLATRDKEWKPALRHLQKAFVLHGDACQAGQAYVETAKHVKRGASLDKAGVRAILNRNAKCPLPAM